MSRHNKKLNWKKTMKDFGSNLKKYLTDPAFIVAVIALGIIVVPLALPLVGKLKAKFMPDSTTP